MKTSTRSALKFATATAILLGAIHSLTAQVSYVSGTYTQNFDSLATAATIKADAFDFADNVTLPGWYAESLTTNYTGAAATFTLATTVAVSTRADKYSISDNSTNAGDLYSSGTLNSTDRALGSVGSSSIDYFYGVRITNNTGSPLKNFTVTYDGEQWRRGGTATERAETLNVAYRIGGTALDNSGTWILIPELAFTSPNITPTGPGVAAGLDGNATANRVAGITKKVTAAIANGESVWIVFADADDVGNDHAMAVDNFSFTAEVNTGSNVSVGAGSTFTATDLAGAPFTAIDTAVFSGSGRTITLSNSAGSVAAAALKFSSSGFTLAGDSAAPLTLNGTVTVDTSVTAEISGVIAGSFGFDQKGLGSITLSGANTFVGPVGIEGRVIVTNDAALGDAANDIAFAGSSGVLAVPAGFTLGSGRSVGGSGTLVTSAAGSVSIAGPLSATALTINTADTLNLTGSSKTVGSLTFANAAALNITGGDLQVTSGLAFNQISGNSTITGNVGFNSGTKTLSIGDGSVRVNGTLTLGGGRIQKIGAGTFDLTGSSTVVSGTGGLQVGIVGNEATMREGGTVKINDAGDLGTLQIFFNSGTLAATAPITSPISMSIGGRADTSGASLISLPTLSGSNLTFTGNDNYFFYNAAVSAAYDRVAVEVNNTTRFEGTFAKTGTSATVALTSRVFILVGGTGTLEFAGNASAIVDDFDLDDSTTLSIASGATLGGRRVFVDSGTTLAGAGTFVGQANDSVEPAVLVASGGTLNPIGILTLKSSLNLGGSVQFNISGLTPGSGYDRVALTNTASTTAYTLTYGGNLNLDFGATAANGDYTLFTTGANITRTGSFSAVALTGTYSGSLTASGTTWSGTVGGKTFSFEETTGVLTVSGGVTPLEAWRSANFPGSTATTGNGADTADYDGDGLANLLEYATDTDPVLTNTKAKVASPSLVVASTVTNVGGTFLTLSYPKNPAATDVTYTVQATNDLGVTFTTGGGSTSVSGNSVTYTDNVPLSSTNARRFLRIQVAH
jgi:hypothetical protein